MFRNFSKIQQLSGAFTEPSRSLHAALRTIPDRYQFRRSLHVASRPSFSARSCASRPETAALRDLLDRLDPDFSGGLILVFLEILGGFLINDEDLFLRGSPKLLHRNRADPCFRRNLEAHIADIVPEAHTSRYRTVDLK